MFEIDASLAIASPFWVPVIKSLFLGDMWYEQHFFIPPSLLDEICRLQMTLSTLPINIPSDDDDGDGGTFLPNIPTTISIPANNVPIAHLLKVTLPIMSFGIPLVKAKTWFSKDRPHEVTEEVLNRPLPSLAQIEQLEAAFEMQTRFGARSIVDNRVNNGRDRLPLWILTYWKTTEALVQGQKTWMDCDNWLARESRTPETTALFDRIRTSFESTAWNSQLRCYGIPTSILELSCLLDQVSLSDNHLDMMMASIGQRTRQDAAVGSRVIIGTTAFSRALNDVAKQWHKTGEPSSRQQIVLQNESLVKDSGRRVIYYPGFVRSNHWIAVRVDFDARTIAYGDSLAHQSHLPPKLFDGLQSWLHANFDGPFKVLGDILEHGSQKDIFSCGICTANTIAHAVLHDSLWTRARKGLERGNWFLTLLSHCRSMTRTAPKSLPLDSDDDNQSSDMENVQVDGPPSEYSNTESDMYTMPENTPSNCLSSPDSVRSHDDMIPESDNHDAPLSLAHLLNPRMQTQSMDSEVDRARSCSPDDHMSCQGSLSQSRDYGIGACSSVSNFSAMDDIRSCNSEHDQPKDSATSENRPESEPAPKRRLFSIFTKSYAKVPQSMENMKSSSSSSCNVGSSRERASSPISSLSSSLRTGIKAKALAAGRQLADATSVLRKRRRSSVSVGSQAEDKPEAINLGAVGISRSASASRANRKAGRTASWRPSLTKLEKWKGKLIKEDPDVQFLPNNGIDARHSACGVVILGKDIYDASRFLEHIPKCDALKPAGDGMKAQTLTSMWANSGTTKVRESKATASTEKPKMLPCPGLTASDDPRIPAYAERSGAEGGGARSLPVIAKERFDGRAYRDLDEEEKQEVRDVQKHEHAWRTEHDNRRVFSTDCLHEVSQGHKKADGRTSPCSQCETLLKNRRFSAVLSKKTPKDKDFKYTNSRWRAGVLGSIYARAIDVKEIIETADARNSPAVKYAKGVLKGKYKGREVFTGLVEAMVSKLDREERGVGMQNFHYSPSYDEFIHIVSIQSPEVHRFLSEHLPARTERSFREKEARQPKFPIKICKETFSLVAEQLKSLNYEGPVALSCDDTKLFGAWRMYWDGIEKGFFLVGAAGEPLRVANPDELKRMISEASLVKASKVRLWCLQIPLPKVAPIVVAAIPIEGTMSASDLLGYLEPLLHGLLARKIRVISYACDGTESERSLQRLISDRGTGQIQHSIPNFFDSSSPFDIRIPTFDGYPIVMIQDSKHALKTFRNNLFSGARLLVLGNYVAIYEHVRQMAMEDGSPLYHRDVNKLDRQDDNAASRLFSAATLEYLAQHHPEYLGEIIYLFVFGELVDAYQNRQISHGERIKMALRAKYFLNMWSLYLQHAGYKVSQHFLSREAADIASILVHGLLGLMLIHCDHLPDAFPLLPWLHSSEPCEHVFGEARCVVKDFTMLDFLHMIPKLRVKLKEAAFRATTGDAKARASGYSHTYFAANDTDLHALAMYPDDSEISRISQAAFEDAQGLISLLGIQSAYLTRPAHDVPMRLPGITSWYHDGTPSADDTSDNESNVDEESTCDAQELQDLIDAEEEGQLGPGFTQAEDEAILHLKCAALAVTADEFAQIQSLPDEEDLPNLHAQQHDEIQDIVSNIRSPQRIAALDLPDEPTQPLGLGHLSIEDIDFSALIAIRCRNQTRQAAKGVRQASSRQNVDLESSRKATLTIRQELIQQFYEIIKAQQERAIGTGYERAARWTVPDESGNVANARLALQANASTVLAKRKKVFTQAQVPDRECVVTARVSTMRPLRIGDYGIIFTENGLMVAHVIALYSKSNGRYGKHCSVQEAGNIAGLSYVAVQAFQYMHARQFASVTRTTAAWQTKQFMLAPSISFLSLLPRTITPVVITRTGLELHTDAACIFDTLSKGLPKFSAAMKQFRSRKKMAASDDEVD